MKRDPRFHCSVFGVDWIATLQQVCDDPLVLLGHATLRVGDRCLNVLRFSSRDHYQGPRSHADTPHVCLMKMCASSHDVTNVWVYRRLYTALRPRLSLICEHTRNTGI